MSCYKMSRYVIALLLVNIYSQSLGNPLPSSVSNGPVSGWLSGLAKRCENAFLNSQIDNVLKNCSVDVFPLHEKQVQCLSFYEVNTRLCDAVAEAKLVITDEAKAKLDEQVSVEDLCVASKKWKVTNLEEYEPYQHDVQNIFRTTPICVKACAANDDDIMNMNANFFCRYYQWGLDLLAQAAGKITTQSAIANSAVDETKNDIQVVSASTGIVPSIVNLNSTQNNVIKPNETKEIQLPTKLKTEQVKTEAAVETTDVKNEISGAANTGSEIVSDIVKPSQEEQVNIPQVGPLSNEGMDKPSAAGVQPQQSETQSNVETPNNNQQSPQKLDVQSKPKPQIPEDYPDSDDGKEDGLTDIQGGDDGDDMVSDPEMKQDFVLKNTNKKVETISSFNGEMEMFPNSIQDGFSDDDVHFFTFFLTAAGLVILFYILYHNKSKVSKVILGLIVEGRQSGRRRNSRGHAYRRLDTLEQAMSTNSTAPPSTIIY